MACALLCAPAFADSRAERVQKERRERADEEWEWRRKYEADWKAFLSGNGRVYRRWAIASKEDRKAFEEYRKARGLKPLPWRFLH